jgi:lysozyme family protein
LIVADFIPAFERTLLAEGGYKLTNNAGDKGRQTYAGISRRANPGWPGWSYIDRSERPPSSLVRDLYRDAYWTPLRLDEVAHQRMAESIYDFAVNAGTRVSAMLAQITIGATPDGAVGPKTIAALNSTSDPALFLARFTIAKIARYRDIVDRDPSQLKWLKGWLNRTLQEAT